jgi:hypothetical protein
VLLVSDEGSMAEIDLSQQFDNSLCLIRLTSERDHEHQHAVAPLALAGFAEKQENATTASFALSKCQRTGALIAKWLARDHNHWHARGLGHRGTHRPQAHPRVSTAAVTAQHHELRFR